MPFGAKLLPGSGVRFRLWAPAARQVELRLEPEGARFAMSAQPQGWFELVTGLAAAGTRYQFRIDGEIDVPDPASRFQPHDVLGPSEVMDAGGFSWNDEGWRGRAWEEAVIYELHVGAFTPQ